MSVSVLVPYTSGDMWRERAWAFVKAKYESEHPDWELIEGSCEGEWSKGAAVADAFDRASGDVVIVADADSYTDADTMRNAVAQTGDQHQWIVPHLKVFRLSIAGTRRVYRGDPVHYGHTIREVYAGLPGGGITVLTRSAYAYVGGIDPRFKGWGGEDISFGWALETLCGPGGRLNGDLWHLWHPHAAPSLHGSPEAEALAGRYRDARLQPVAMRALIKEVEPWRSQPQTTSPSSSTAR